MTNQATKEIVAVRGSTHGDFSANAEFAQSFKYIMRSTLNWSKLTGRQAEALDLIATKISRILTGDPQFKDHWDDIGGYAALGATEEDQRG